MPGPELAPELAIVIPAYNEAETIFDVVKGVANCGHVIVVDDASQDDTAQLAADAGADVVRHPHNKGYDQALDTGIQRAAELDATFVLTFDADGQHEPQTVAKYLDLLRSGNDLVLGVRQHKQRLAEHVFAFVTNLLYGIKDPLCGMKGYALSLYRKLGHFDSYGSINTELALFGVRAKVPFCQIPITIRERQDAPRFAAGWRANRKIFGAMIKAFF